MKPVSVGALLVLALFSGRPVRSDVLLRTDFKRIFNDYAKGVRFLLDDDKYCGRIYQRHLGLYNAAKESGKSDDDNYELRRDELTDVQSVFGLSSSSNLVVECILENTPELIKARMASAQVLMGLTPSLLAILAPQAWQTGIIVSVGKRPLLALLLALGAPTLSPSLTSGGGLKEALLKRKGGSASNEAMKLPTWLTDIIRDGRVGGHPVWRRLIGAVGWLGFHALAAASVANVAELVYRLITQSFLSFHSGSNWLIIMWTSIGVLVHLLGTVAVWLRIKRQTIYPAQDINDLAEDTASSHAAAQRRDGLLNITSPFARTKSQIEITPPGLISMFLTWFTVIYSVAHVFFGTLLFSSFLFISVEDGVGIVLRLLASVVFCRFGMEYEMVMEMRDVEIVDPKTTLKEEPPSKPPQLPPVDICTRR